MINGTRKKEKSKEKEKRKRRGRVRGERGRSMLAKKGKRERHVAGCV